MVGKIRRIGSVVVAMAAITLECAACGVPRATYSAQDILQYQLQLNQSDPSFNNREPAPLIAAGEEVCKGLDSGKSVDKVGVDLGNAHFSSVEAADIVLAATSNLCTDHQQEVKNWAGM